MKDMKLWMIIIGTSLLMIGCTTQKNAPVVKQPVKEVKAPVKHVAAPKKNIELKEVEDTNFSSEYMYPETKKKKKKTVAVAAVDATQTTTPIAATSTMSKGECVAMIGQKKFDKYTQMLGDEASAIKRCQMLKAM